MNDRPVLLSSAYFPPVQYMSLVASAGKVMIEREENYIKQTYRNRFYILSPNGILSLPVPVLEGSFHKTPIKDIRIDYSKRWQQVHLRGIYSSYRAAPYFEYLYDKVEKIISHNFTFLLDLNMASLMLLVEFTGIKADISYTENFEPVRKEGVDLRYFINPKKREMAQIFRYRNYIQVFSDRFPFMPGLSTLDLIFNTGPDAAVFLPEIVLPDYFK